jgi:hypothetical protein
MRSENHRVVLCRLPEQLLLCVINYACCGGRQAPHVLKNQLSLKYDQRSGELMLDVLVTISIQGCLAAVCIIHA